MYAKAAATLSSKWVVIFQWCLALTIPLWLILTSVQLVATDVFLHLVYDISVVTPDPYGFTEIDRRHYASFALDYLRNAEEIDYLTSLKFPDGNRLFNERELSHMQDVKHVFQAFCAVYGISTILVILAAVVMLRNMTTRINAVRAFRTGGYLTLGIIIAVIIISITSWNTFFEQFHNLFFVADSWRFEYSDTLIRLFPETFWLTAVISIGFLSAAGATGLILFSTIWQRRNQ